MSLLVPLIGFALAVSASAAIFTVNSTGDASDPKPGEGVCGTVQGVMKTDPDRGPCTLRAAIQEANAFAGTDTIQFNIPASDPNCTNGVCTINLTQALPDLSTNIDIAGPGTDKLIVRRNSGTEFRIFNVTTTGSVTLSGMTISNGSVTVTNETGGGVRNASSGTVNLTNCVLSGNSARNGGGIDNTGSNTVNSGIVNVTNSTLMGNSAAFGGGGINNSGTVNVNNSTLTSNSALLGGGGLSNFSSGPITGTANITNSTLNNNSTVTTGGGILNSSGSRVNVTNSTLSGNSVLQPAASTGNGLEADGGAISTGPGDTVTITNSTFSGNSVVGGKGGNNGQGGNGEGGAIYNDGATVSIINSTFSGNSATGGGGTGPTFGSGGAGEGGGIRNKSGTISVTNSTFSGNSATGGATVPSGFGSGAGGGINNSGTIQLKSTIIARSTASASGPDVNGSFTSQGFNLIGKNDGAAASFPAGNPNANGDIVGTGASPVDPKFDPAGLQNNGGPTPTIALILGSPALDKGTSTNLTTDQRGTGFARTFDDPAIPNGGGNGTDIGAFEVQPVPTPTPTPTPTPSPTATPTVLGNISTRLRVETGDNVLIGGFIITGTQDKKVIIRAIGPSLPVADALADPFLALHDGSGQLLDSNDNWVDSPNKQAIIDSTIPPSNDLESAIVATLPANSSAYTAIVRGVNNTTGVGLVEVYDLDRTVDSKLANISTRGLVQTGDNVMIGGFIVLGSSSQKVIVRAIGPSLPVSGALADPTLELHDGNGALVEFNDNWVDSPNKQAIIDSTIPPTNDLESAIVQTLPPGNYTAIVAGVNDATGVALVEVYALP